MVLGLATKRAITLLVLGRSSDGLKMNVNRPVIKTKYNQRGLDRQADDSNAGNPRGPGRNSPVPGRESPFFHPQENGLYREFVLGVGCAQFIFSRSTTKN
jgi:hypothetical protein